MLQKGLVFDIKKYSIHDGPGTRTTVHLKGCPLSCWWCHNPESQSSLPQILFRQERCIGCGKCIKVCRKGAISVADGLLTTDDAKCIGCGLCCDKCPAEAREICGRKMSVEEVMTELMKDEIFFRTGGVTFSGGEPFMQPEFLMSMLDACKQHHFHRAIDTSGFVQQSVIKDSVSRTNLYLYDIKHMDSVQHKKYTGVDNVIILENLVAISEMGANINIRVPFMPGINTDDKNIEALAKFVSPLKGITGVNILPYHTVAKGKHERWGMNYKLCALMPPTENQTRHAAHIIENCGLKVHIGG